MIGSSMLTLSAYLLLAIPAVALSQSAPQPADDIAARPLTWDVVSIKPHKELDSSGSMYMRPDGIEINNLTIHSLFWGAFEIRSQDQIAGWPSWADSDHFDVRAKLSAEDAEVWHKLRGEERSRQWHQLMRQILEGRFAMKAHIEKRTLPVYDLVVAKNGPKLKESAPDEAGLNNYAPGKISAKSTLITSLVVSLSGNVGRMIIDKTGLTGKYDVELTWAPNNEPDAGPSIFTAIQEQLGLKLESSKAPVDVVVIDHLERPSEN